MTKTSASPVLVLRDTTERPEGIAAGTLKLAGTDEEKIYELTKELLTNESEYEKMAFVGDLIFKENIGNYTFPGGDKTTLLSSIHNYIFKLPYNTILYTGHGENTTVLQEKFFHDNHTF